MKIRIIKPEVNAIQNDWGYEYDYSDTIEIELNDFPRWFLDSLDKGEIVNEESVKVLENIAAIMGHFIETRVKELSLEG